MSSTLLTLRQPLQDFSENVTYIISDIEKPKDFFVCGVANIVSEKVMSVITSHSDAKVQFFPVQVIFNEESAGKYYYMNVFSEVDCFDFEKSKYDYDNDFDIIESIHQLILKPVDERHKLFFVENIDFPILCISETLTLRLKEAGCTGIKFMDPSQIFC